MAVEKQLSVFLENKPGALARLYKSFAKANVNVIAISVSDTVDHAVIRMVVSDPQRAIELLEQHGVLVVDNEVLSVRLANRPGALSELAEKLSKSKVNIEYAYGTAGQDKNSSLLILRVSDLKKARKVLKD
ncbi:MAG: ACT domain-containing protein [Planctomycetota bacterium]|nr:ACT domain-containing protein [Planctomycetota bacterium]